MDGKYKINNDVWEIKEGDYNEFFLYKNGEYWDEYDTYSGACYSIVNQYEIK